MDQFVPPLENYYEDSPHNMQANIRESIQWAQDGWPVEAHGWHARRWYSTTNMTLDVKRALPVEGVKWLFA